MIYLSQTSVWDNAIGKTLCFCLVTRKAHKTKGRRGVVETWDPCHMLTVEQMWVESTPRLKESTFSLWSSWVMGVTGRHVQLSTNDPPLPCLEDSVQIKMENA